MQLESHATPQKESPQQRYATLHRAIERGLDSDEVWRELAEVSLQLGHHDEAVTCLQRIRSSVVQQILQSKLIRTGVLADPSDLAETAREHAAVPAASNAGQRAAKERTGPPATIGLQDHVVDAVQYLFHQHMPLLVLMTTLAFPLVVGLGGFLTAGGSPILLAAIAALPGLMVVAVVGAMGRQILVASSQGSGDVPSVPEFGQLVADARRFLGDAGLVLGALLVPSLLAMALGAPLVSTLPAFLVGAFFTPLAWALRQVRGDVGSLSPTILMRGVKRCGIGYFGLVPVCWLLFAPAAAVAWTVFGRPVWVQIAMIGPLCVVPLFIASRLLGTWLDTKRTELGGLLQPTPVKAASPSLSSATNAPPAARPRLPRRPDKLEHFTPPNLRRNSTKAMSPAVGQTTPRASAPAARPPAARPAPARPERTPASRATAPAQGQRPVHQQAPARPAAHRPAAPATPAAPAPAPAASRKPAPQPAPRAIEGRGPRRSMSDQPDLSNLPGAVVVSGRERKRHGAAARHE